MPKPTSAALARDHEPHLQQGIDMGPSDTILPDPGNAVIEARSRWLSASDRASTLANELFQPGSGYGDPDALFADQHRLESARREAERLFREYQDLERQRIDNEMLKLQRSQQLATWASFAVAAVVGTATIVSTVIALLK